MKQITIDVKSQEDLVSKSKTAVKDIFSKQSMARHYGKDIFISIPNTITSNMSIATGVNQARLAFENGIYNLKYLYLNGIRIF